MKNLCEEIYRLMDNFLVEADKPRPLDRLNQDRHLFVDNMENLFRSRIEDILIELRHIRANAPLTVGDGGRTRDRLRDLIEVIEGAK